MIPFFLFLSPRLDELEEEISSYTSSIEAFEKKKTNAWRTVTNLEKEVKEIELAMEKMVSEEDLEQLTKTAEERRAAAATDVLKKTDVTQDANFEVTSLRNKVRLYINLCRKILPRIRVQGSFFLGKYSSW